MAPHKEATGIEGNSFRNLLFFLSLYIVGSPFLAPYPRLAILVHASLSVVLFVAVNTVQKQRGQRSFAVVLLLPLLALYWLGIYDIVQFTQPGSYLLLVVYFALLVYSYIQQIAHSRKVTKHVLYATFSLYLIIGLLWGAVYALLEQLNPGSYSGALLEDMTGGSIHIFNYFSMVTLTTLGYGDITPQTAGAASLCQFEAIVGQFFTAVLVAWLVGNYLNDKQEAR
jgi:voltage-gated potassium channel